MGIVYIIATPIGNLEDLSPRAARILREATLVVSEDKRVTGKLISHLGLRKAMITFHEYSDQRELVKIIDELESGGSVAIVTDAGTPGISDPGAFLVSEILRRLPETKIFAIPGPSALAAAISVAGLRAEPFIFFGFPPEKKGRQSFFRSLTNRVETLVFLESPHRIVKTLEELLASLGGDRRAFVGRELTKLHETHYRGALGDVTEAVKKGTLRGEYVIIIAAK